MLKFRKNRQTAILPKRALEGDAGFDVFWDGVHDGHRHSSISIDPGEDILFDTGISSEFSSDFVLMVCNKSGIATKKRLQVGADIVDSNYRGSIHVHLHNLSTDTPAVFNLGDKIAQLILVKIYPGNFEIVEEMSETERGDKGFGSTGSNISN